MRARSLAAAAVALGVAVGCATTDPPPRERDLSRLERASAEGVAVLFARDELDPAEIALVASELSVVRRAVAAELALVLSSSESAPPHAEVVLSRDAGWGQERWLVTHAKILERPLRVQVPAALPEEDRDAAKILARIRGTVAHELAESSVLVRVPVLDPFLRWMHDGIAESVEYRVLLRLDPKAAQATLARYEQYARAARARRRTWVDLTRWRQLSDSMIHSDVLFGGPRGLPLRLDDLAGSLRRLGQERFATQDAAVLAVMDDLQDMLADCWIKDGLGCAPDELALDPRDRESQFLGYDASFALFLELERAHPGLTAQLVAAIGAWRRPVLRSADVVRMIETIGGERISARLERFSFERLDAILARERALQGF